jgi:hypothetical protein
MKEISQSVDQDQSLLWASLMLITSQTCPSMKLKISSKVAFLWHAIEMEVQVGVLDL